MGLRSGEGRQHASSILFDHAPGRPVLEERKAPTCFGDLNLDQVVAAVTADREEYDLEPFLFTPAGDVDTVAYRQAVFRDLDGRPLFDQFRAFAARLRSMRDDLAKADKLRFRYQKERWFLDAVDTYCAAVVGLVDDLRGATVESKGLQRLRDDVTDYSESDAFGSLATETAHLKDDLRRIVYCVHIDGRRVEVSPYEGQSDYSAEVDQTFVKFKQGAVKDYRATYRDGPEMNHVEEKILAIVAELHPDTFAELDAFCARRRQFLDPAIARFDREVQFYIGYLEYIEPFTRAGLPFCYPRVSNRSKEVFALDTFDLALAHRLVRERAPVVCNDFFLQGPERILVVTGPNQGGKTTLARTFGQLHHLAGIGCPVPGREAGLFLFDRLFTHFEKEEDLTTLSGKLHDDLVRIRAILMQATPDSVVIMNEIFTSTTLNDAVFLGTKVLEQIIDLDLLAVCVTFVDELTSLGPATVSMVATVEPDNPAVRTFKVVRRPADGLSHATAIAQKYGLTYERLRGRIAS